MGIPRAVWALRAADRHDQGVHRRIRPVPGGHGQDVEPEVELEVVPLHRRSELGLAGGGGGPPGGPVEVVPDHPPLDPEDSSVAGTPGRQAGRFQHPLVVGELEHVVLATLRREFGVGGGRLQGQRIEPGAQPLELRGPSLGELQRLMPLDVDGAVPAADGRHQQVRRAHPPAGGVLRQPGGDDRGGPMRQCGLGLRRTRRAGRLVDDHRLRVQPEDLGDDLGLEGDAASDEALGERVGRRRLAGQEGVVLGSHGTAFGDVSPLGRDRADVAAGGHQDADQGLAPAMSPSMTDASRLPVDASFNSTPSSRFRSSDVDEKFSEPRNQRIESVPGSATMALA